MSEDLFNDASWLIASIMRGLLEFPEDTPGVRHILSRIAEQDLSYDNFKPAAPQRRPGCRYLPETVTAGLLVSADFCQALVTIEDQIHWNSSDHYDDEMLEQPGFIDNATYAEFIGETGFFKGDDFRLGVMIIGPDLLYKDHMHAAPELYWLLTGPIEYSRGQGRFETVGTADTIWNEPNEIHAMKIGSRPLMCVFAWANDVDQLPQVVP